MSKIAVIGAGAMGGATVEGLIKGDYFRNEDITVADPSQKVIDKFAQMGLAVTTDNQLAAESADVVCVVVKPWLVEHVLKDIKPGLDPQKQLLIVIAAGVPSASIKEWLGEKCPPLFLVIPNIAIAEMASMTFIVPVGASEKETQIVVDIFNEMGNALITDEQHLAAGTTLASCGIAYAMRYIRAASEGGVELGFKAYASRSSYRPGGHAWRCHHQRTQRNGARWLHLCCDPRTESWCEIRIIEKRYGRTTETNR